MFKYRKGLLISLLIGLTLSSSFAEADTPNAPGSYVGVSKLSSTSVRISTKDNSDNEDGFYALLYDYETSVLVQKKQISDSNNNHIYADFTGLVCDKLYSTNVLAFNEDGNSSVSDTRNFNIHTTFSTTCPNNIDVPSAPGSYIGITDINKSAVRVNFLDNSDNEDGFVLFDESGDINVTIPANNATAPSQTYVTLENLICNETYTIKALAFNGNGNSEMSDAQSFNINTTFSIPCPSIKLSSYPNKIILRTSGQYEGLGLAMDTNIVNEFDSPIISCKWELDGNSFLETSCEDVKVNIGFTLNNWLSISPSDVLKNKKHKITTIITDTNGVSATDSIPVQFIDDGSDSIYISAPKRVLKVGETMLIEAYVNNIIPQTFCHSTVQGHSWGESDNLGTFDDSMFETGHFICYGYRASTSYTALEKGNTILKLFANGGEKDINITIVAPNYTKDSIKKITVDNITGLMWQDNDTIKKPWTEGSMFTEFNTSGDTATTYCNNLNWGGYDDWRIPNINELSSYVFRNDEEHWASTENSYLDDVLPAMTSKLTRWGNPNNPNLLVKCVRNIH